MGDSLLLNGGVHDHALQLDWLDGFDLQGGVDGGFEQLLQAFFAQRAAKAPDLGGITGRAGFVVRHASEILPKDVLALTTPKRCTSSSSLRLKAFLRCCRLVIKRMGNRARPAGLMPAPNCTSCSPSRSRVATFDPRRASRAKWEPGPVQSQPMEAVGSTPPAGACGRSC